MVLDEVLCRMEKQDEGLSQGVMLRFFARLTSEDAAKALAISSLAAKRERACAGLSSMIPCPVADAYGIDRSRVRRRSQFFFARRPTRPASVYSPVGTPNPNRRPRSRYASNRSRSSSRPITVWK